MVPSMKTQYIINQCEVRVDLKFACSHDLCHLIYYGGGAWLHVEIFSFFFCSYREKPVVMKLHCGYELQYNMNCSNWAADYKDTQEKSCF